MPLLALALLRILLLAWDTLSSILQTLVMLKKPSESLDRIGKQASTQCSFSSRKSPEDTLRSQINKGNCIARLMDFLGPMLLGPGPTD
jgi:hypothetical protein